MKKISLLQRFSLLSLAAFLMAGLALGAILTSSVKKSAIDRLKNETAQFVAAEVDRVFRGMDFSLPMAGPRYEDFQKGVSHLLFNPSIKRIKVWNLDSVVVWSDERHLVGKQFPNDKELLEALNGAVSSEMMSPDKPETRTESRYSRLLELYIPIRSERDGKVKAVIEIYQDLEYLDADTARLKRTLWISIVAGFSGIYFACFGIVWRASRRLTEQALEVEKSEERNRDLARELTSLINNVPGIVYRGHRDWSLSFIGAEVEPVTGHSPDKFTSGAVGWKEIIHPDDMEQVKEAFRKADKEKVDTLRVEYRIRNKDGGIRWIEDRRQLIHGESGVFATVDGLLLDITERKEADRRIEESHYRFRALADTAPDGIITVDAQGNIAFINPAGERQFGYTDNEVMGKDITILIPARYRSAHQAGMERFLKTQTPRIIGKTVELEGLRKDGSEFPIELSLSTWASKEGLFFFAIIRDITERKRAEAEKEKLQTQLLQAQKMEAVGRLAGGVAHDFNNLLTVINGYSEILLQKVGKESPVFREVDEIRLAGERAALLTQQLLAFSRKQVIEPKVLDLNLLVANLGKMLVRLIGENIDLKTVPGKGLGLVKVDPGQFEQVLVNLAVNARDAMPDGGTLLIETANVELDEEYCAQRPYEICPGWFVRLAVSDTGHGMAEEIKKKIFEPFFTTKEKGKGTGLGLSMIYGVVKQSGGSLEAYSEVGKGTTFKIYLPMAEGAAAKPRESRPALELSTGSETVLLVEDEITVRKLGVRILGDLGYKVMQAGNGDEAISLVRGYGDRIDLLLTDVVMPGMNGSELAAQLVLHHPEMKVLFTSGYTDDAIAHHGVLDEGVSFIGKPYTPNALARKVREVLDKA